MTDAIDARIVAIIRTLEQARRELASGKDGLAHFDLTRAHVALHEADGMLIQAMLGMEPTHEVLPEAIR